MLHKVQMAGLGRCQAAERASDSGHPGDIFSFPVRACHPQTENSIAGNHRLSWHACCVHIFLHIMLLACCAQRPMLKEYGHLQQGLGLLENFS